MKLRIKGDSLRLRLTQGEVSELAQPSGASDSDLYEVAKRQGLELFHAHPQVDVHLLRDTIHDIPLHRPAVLADLIGAWLDRLPNVARER